MIVAFSIFYLYTAAYGVDKLMVGIAIALGKISIDVYHSTMGRLSDILNNLL